MWCLFAKLLEREFTAGTIKLEEKKQWLAGKKKRGNTVSSVIQRLDQKIKLSDRVLDKKEGE